MAINIQLRKESKINEIEDLNNLPFGKVFSDYMVVWDYEDGQWLTPQVLPFGDLTMSPAMSGIHYGQSVFEGLKVCKNDADEVLFFRIKDNFNRLNLSATRMAMPEIPEEPFMEAINALLSLDSQWVPTAEGSSMYVRPVYFATDAYIKVHVSLNYRLIILCSPTGPYFDAPMKVSIETTYARSSEGGTGMVKAAGNYGASLYPAKLAQEKGYNQVIWTDSSTHEYIEETGATNIFFIINGTVITPSLSSSKLAGITRDSVLTLVRSWGLQVEERNVSVAEIITALENGTMTEAFGTGTAAGVAPIGLIGHKDKQYSLPDISTWTIGPKIKDTLNGLRKGQIQDQWNWVSKVKDINVTA